MLSTTTQHNTTKTTGKTRVIAHPPLRYFGAKWRLAPWLITHFPPHVCFVDVFGGGMSVTLRKPPSIFNVYNDIDCQVVTFFRVLRDRSEELVRAIELTPFARAELATAYEPTTDDLEIARRLFIRCWQSIGGPGMRWNSGWRFQVKNSRGKKSIEDWNDLDHLHAVAERLRSIYIECDDALKIIKRYDSPTTLFYLDPPYLPETRSNRWREHAYTCEMTVDQHFKLARRLQAIKGMAVVSGYPSTSYDKWYSGWRTYTKRARVNTGRKGAGLATEKIWISPNAIECVGQPNLIDGVI